MTRAGPRGNGPAPGPRAAPVAGGPRFPALTVQGWFGVAFAAIAVLALAAAVTVAQLLGQNHSVATELEGGILPAQAQAYRLQGALVDQETGVRGYGITGQVSFLRPYTTGLATQTDAESRLRSLIGRNALLAADLRRLDQAAAGWRRSYATPLIVLAGRGPLGGRDLSLLNRSKKSFDHLRALSVAQNAHLAAAAASDKGRLSTTRSVSNWAFIVILVVFLLASAALALVLHNAVVQPLGRLRAAARHVVAGDFGHRIEASGPKDLRAVAADVEAMRGELAAALADARAAQEVAARQAEDLDAQAADLLRSNAELEQFAYVASHDLQEPLRKVASFCQLLEKRYSDQLDDRGRQYIGFAVDGAKRLQILINDLLTFSRVGRADDLLVRVQLDRALDIALAGLGTAIEESGSVIERPTPLPEVMGDATLLAMLWQNLIGNAIKFRAPDRAPVVRITVEDDQVAGMWQFCVVDNGIGVAPEFAEKIFVIFQRLHGREAYPGTGIGLALCKRIVEHHGGEIRLDTAYADGARVCFTLPVIDRQESEQQQAKEIPGTGDADESGPGTGAPGEGAPGQGAVGQDAVSEEGIPA